ncbi:MAG TPA: hypothetical protein VEC57_14275 [Candidatus Limnocylindrales bacterium]|nr:hypothetical protein [Candidatus Limnocylindrales bacterium]
MPAMSFGEFYLHYDAPESGRYRAPILVLAGLFQSFGCWRPVTSMLAHRGWEVYCLTRVMPDREGDPRILDDSWEGARARIAQVAARLDSPLVLFGSDAGAALSLSVCGELPVLALAMFSPSEPAALAAAHHKTLGLRQRLLGRGGAGADATVAPQPQLVGEKVEPSDILEEPAGFVDALAGTSFARPEKHPPALVFVSENDPLVPHDQAMQFVREPYAKASRMRLNGRFWPVTGGANVADEVHRFLILTLGDRVVDFPDEILDD